MEKEKLTAAMLTDRGICPTCYNREHDNIIYGDNSDEMLFENEHFECFLCDRPRAIGHTIILS